MSYVVYASGLAWKLSYHNEVLELAVFLPSLHCQLQEDKDTRRWCAFLGNHLLQHMIQSNVTSELKLFKYGNHSFYSVDQVTQLFYVHSY